MIQTKIASSDNQDQIAPHGSALFATAGLHRSICPQTFDYHNDPKFSDIQVWANNADPDQTAPREAV